MKKTGNRHWYISAGYIPLESKGEEPAFTSRDEIAILNTNETEADVTIHVFFEDSQPAGPYHVKIAGEKVRKIRINDLIDPLPVPLEKNYSLEIISDRNIVVQFTKLSSAKPAFGAGGMTAYHDPSS